jgi:hypothetical protein
MQEVGCPEPAAVVAIIESTLSLRAFSLMASTVEADGPVDEVTLMGLAPLRARIEETKSYIVPADSASRFPRKRFSEQLDVSDQHDQRDRDKHENERQRNDQDRCRHLLLCPARSDLFFFF